MDDNIHDVDPDLAHAIDRAVIDMFGAIRRLHYLTRDDAVAGAYAEQRVGEWERMSAAD